MSLSPVYTVCRLCDVWCCRLQELAHWNDQVGNRPCVFFLFLSKPDSFCRFLRYSQPRYLIVESAEGWGKGGRRIRLEFWLAATLSVGPHLSGRSSPVAQSCKRCGGYGSPGQFFYFNSSRQLLGLRSLGQIQQK